MGDNGYNNATEIVPTPQTDEKVSPPISGMWVIESDDDLTPEIVEHAESVLTSAAREGRQVVVTEGITFKWRLTPVEREASSPALDVERLRQALHAVYGDHDFRTDAPLIAAEYARLSTPEPPA